MSEETQKLEDLPAETHTLTPEEAEQVTGGIAKSSRTVIRIDFADDSEAAASGAMKTIAAAQTD